MTKTFTKNELVRYLYNEGTKQQSTDIYQSKLTDQDLEDEIYSLDEIREQVERFQMKTPAHVTRKILQYSAGFQG
jgi:hypothetical protein